MINRIVIDHNYVNAFRKALQLNTYNRKFIIFSILFLCISNLVRSEGTKQTTPYNASSGAEIQLQINRSSTGGQASTFAGWTATSASDRLFINIKDYTTERIYLGFQKANSGQTVYYRIKRPDGTVVSGPTAIPNSGTGYISTWSQANIGPSNLSGNNSGYDAIVFNPNANAASQFNGDFYIEFNATNTTANTTEVFLKYYDITVANGSANTNVINGRLWSYNWGFNSQSFDQNGYFGSLFSYTTDQVVTEIDLNGIKPYYFRIFNNQWGPKNDSTVEFNRKSVQGSSGSYQYKLFLNNPDSTVYPSNPDGDRNVTFSGLTGCGDQFCFNISIDGAAQSYLVLDLNNNGVYTDPIDRLLEQTVVAGANCLAWDGKDGLGNTVAANVTFSIAIATQVGVTHLPIYDAENHPNGYLARLVRPLGIGTMTMYYDNSGLSNQGGVTSSSNFNGTTPPVPVSGNSINSNGINKWNTTSGSSYYGDDRTINTWWTIRKSVVTNMTVVKPFCADLVITKTDSIDYYLSGSTNLYTINVTNNGPDPIPAISGNPGARVQDTAPIGTTITSWTATFTGGATGTASGTGNIDQYVNLPVNSTVRYRVNLNLPNNLAGTLLNLATITSPVQVPDNNPSNNSATDTTLQATNTIDLAIFSQSNITCFGQNNGAATISVSGGFPPFQYVWSPSGGNAASASGLGANTYTVLVTDSYGFTKTITVTITQPSQVTANAGANQIIGCSPISTTIGTAGVGGVSYAWSPSIGLNSSNIPQPIASPLTTTVYTVTATGLNGCTATSSVTVTVNTNNPNANAGSNVTTTCASFNANIGSTAVIGNTYSWLPTNGLSATNIAEPVANPTNSTTYTVTVTGANGCTATSSVTITVNKTAPSADAGGNVTTTCSSPSVNIGTLAVLGHTYSWSPASGLSTTNTAESTANPSNNTTYTVTVTGANGCTATSTVTVTVNKTQPTAYAGSPVFLNCVNTNSLLGSAAIAGYTYSWSPTTNLNTTNIAEPTVSSYPLSSYNTTYTVSITSTNGCTNTSTVLVTVNTLPATADAGSDVHLVSGFTSSQIGNATGESYNWLPASGLNSANTALPIASPTQTTTYTVTASNTSSLCTAIDSVMVTVDQAPSVIDDSYTSSENIPIQNNVSVNDIASVDGGNSWSLIGVNGGALHGTVTMNVNGEFTYTPNPYFHGTDVFSYVVCDLDIPLYNQPNDCDTATVNITIDSIDDFPYAFNDQGSTKENTPLYSSAALNDSLSGDGGNSWTLIGANGGVSHGTVVMNNDGSYTYTPTSGYHGVDQFTYQICDLDSDCDTAEVTIQINIATPEIVPFPNAQFCYGSNIQLHTFGSSSGIFTWDAPVGCSYSIDNSVSGESTLNISVFNSTCNGLFKVYQNVSGNPMLTDSFEVDGGAKPTINFATTACVSNMGEVTVNASGAGSLEYAINGGAYQSSNILTTLPGSTFIVSVKAQNSSCETHYTGECVYCNQGGPSCAAPAKDSLITPRMACSGVSIPLVNYFTNASEANFTSSGTGTFDMNQCLTSPCTANYTPSVADYNAGYVIITATTNDPDGAGPCCAGKTAKLILLANGLVAPTIITNSPVCENSTLTFEATGTIGNISWLANGGYSSAQNPISIPSAPASMHGLLTVTASGFGCTDVTSNQNLVVVAEPNLVVNVNGIPEFCYGSGNGRIEVSVNGGSGIYQICYNGNLANCVTNSTANFNWISPGNYTVTVVDALCPANVFSYPVTVASGPIVPAPTVSTSINACTGQDLQLTGTTSLSGSTINWLCQPQNFNAIGQTVIRYGASENMSGLYYAKTIDSNGCASLDVPVNVLVSPTPYINHVQVTCLGSLSKIDITASMTSGIIEYSIDGNTYQSSPTFNNITTGNYTLHVKNSMSDCEVLFPVFVPNCLCPNEPIVSIDNPKTSCGLAPIPLVGSFTIASNANFVSSGTGSFSVSSGSSPIITSYTPSLADLDSGIVFISLTTNDPDAAGPCTPVTHTEMIYLLDSISKPTITSGKANYCTGDTIELLVSGANAPFKVTGVGGYTSDSLINRIPNATQFHSGIYRITIDGNGCSTQKDSTFLIVAPPPSILITSNSIDEGCYGHGNGEITVSVSGGSGNYMVCNGFALNCESSTGLHTFKWLASGTYTLYASDATCPNARISITDTIFDGLLVAPPTSASYNSPVCEGEDLILTAIGDSAIYTWTDLKNNFVENGQSITRSNAKVEMSGQFKVQRIVDGCASDGLLLNVKVFDYPTIFSADTSCIGGDSGRITILSNILGGDTIEYALNDGPFQDNNAFEYLTNGLYMVKARAKGTDCEIELRDIELYCSCICNKESNVSAFPNPNTGNFTINAKLITPSSDIVISVFDFAGRTIFEKPMEAPTGILNYNVDISTYVAGTYMVRVLIDGERFLIPIQVAEKK